MTTFVAGLALIASAISAVAAQAQLLPTAQVPTQTQLRVEIARPAAAHSGTLTTFSVHVAATDGDAIPSGIVTIADGAHPLGSAAIDENGDAAIEVANLAPGTHAVHALYAGTSELAASFSRDAQVTAQATGTPSFTLTAASTTLSVAQGNAVTTILTLTPVNGFSGYVTLSCSGLPVDSACSFVPGNVFVSGTAASPSTLSITTSAATGPNARLTSRTILVYAFLFPGILALAGLGLRSRRTWRQAGLVLIAVAIAGTLSGCSQRYRYLNRPPQASPGTPLGTSTFNLQAQAISNTTVLSQSLSLTLTVTKPAA